MEFDERMRQEPERKRTTLLSVLCILTFIGSGCSALAYLYMGMSFGTLRHLVFETDTYEAYFNMMPAMRSSMEAVFALPRWYYFLTGFLFVFALAGAILMWRLRRKGFHVYTIAQCLVILTGMLFIPAAGVPWGSILWTGLFVAGYASCLKHMKN